MALLTCQRCQSQAVVQREQDEWSCVICGARAYARQAARDRRDPGPNDATMGELISLLPEPVDVQRLLRLLKKRETGWYWSTVTESLERLGFVLTQPKDQDTGLLGHWLAYRMAPATVRTAS